MGDIVQRVRIYLNENDSWQGQPLHVAVLDQLRQTGATGATALRGVAGFGPGRRTNVLTTSDPVPVVIEWIDRIERIAHILPTFDDMLANALITIEELQIHRAVLRGRGPLPNDRSVGDIMRTQPHTVTSVATLDTALAALIASKQATLPVIDAQRRILGLITEVDIARRTDIRLPLRLWRLLDDRERQDILGPLAERTVADVMNQEMRAVFVSAAIPQALTTMIEWNYQQIPVAERDGTLAGLLDQEDVLRTAVAQVPQTEPNVRDADPPTPVRLVMQTLIPQIADSQSLAMALEQLLATPGGYLVVVDAARRVQGNVSDVIALHRFKGAERAIWLAALQRKNAAVALRDLPGVDQGLEFILERDITTVGPDNSVVDAARQMLTHSIEQMPVVDEEGKLVGMLARGSLLRALVQESE
jgi:CBS-domain-containing membrane protein